MSSVDVETGMVSVIYHDKDETVTQMLPYATFNDEYKLPQVGTKVVVLHLSNGQEMGIVMGTYWNKSNPSGIPGLYHKNLGEGAYLNYDEKILTIAAEHLRFVAGRNPAQTCGRGHIIISGMTTPLYCRWRQKRSISAL